MKATQGEPPYGNKSERHRMSWVGNNPVRSAVTLQCGLSFAISKSLFQWNGCRFSRESGLPGLTFTIFQPYSDFTLLYCCRFIHAPHWSLRHSDVSCSSIPRPFSQTACTRFSSMGKFQQRYVMRHSLFASFFTLPLLQVLVLAFEYLPYLAVFPLRNRILPAN